MTELDLSNNAIKEIVFAFDENLFPKLKLLILSNNKVSSLQFIKTLPKLKVLVLINNRLKNLTCNDANTLNHSGNGLINIPDLEYLDISFNELVDLGGLAQASNLLELKILRLSNNKIQKINFLSHLPKLFEVDLSKNFIKNIDKTSFNIPNVISNLKIEDNIIKTLANIEALQCLTKLSLNGNKLTDLNEIDRLIGMNYLEELALFNTPLCKKNLYRQNIVKKLTKLKILDNAEITIEERNKL
jgi:Leucine-rich repeat (LRR) protein